MIRIKVTQSIIDYCVKQREGWFNPCPFITTLRKRYPDALVIANFAIIANGCGVYTPQRCGVYIDNKKYHVPKRFIDVMIEWDNYKDIQPYVVYMFRNRNLFKRFAKRFTFLQSTYS